MLYNKIFYLARALLQKEITRRNSKVREVENAGKINK